VVLANASQHDRAPSREQAPDEERERRVLQIANLMAVDDDTIVPVELHDCISELQRSRHVEHPLELEDAYRIIGSDLRHRTLR